MSNPRYDWWSYAKAIIRRYPDKCLPNEKQAVEAAIEAVKQVRTGKERLKLIDMVFLKKSHTLEGASMALYISGRTAQRWHSDFIREVGRNFCCSSLIPDTGRREPMPRPKWSGEIFNLSEKQKRIITLMADCNMRLCDVAKRIGVCDRTVYSHIANIKYKTGLNCRDFWDLLTLNKMVRKEDTDG